MRLDVLPFCLLKALCNGLGRVSLLSGKWVLSGYPCAVGNPCDVCRAPVPLLGDALSRAKSNAFAYTSVLLTESVGSGPWPRESDVQ